MPDDTGPDRVRPVLTRRNLRRGVRLLANVAGVGGAMKIERLMNQHSPRVLPSGWELREDYLNARVYWRHGHDPLSVIAEVSEYGGRHWLHVSCSGRTRLPSWAELREVKDLFCGRDVLALQVLPPAAEYVNVDPNVLHLWVALEGPRPTPDFARGQRVI